MIINREVFVTDPAKLELLNHGVAEVKAGRSDAELRTLRYELQTFICEGQYEIGLRRVLETYLGNLGKTEQPGIWVSGFYGSGKSHFLKVLCALWTDEPLPGKECPRGITKVSKDIQDALKELSNEGKRGGGLHAASGTLGAGAGSVRLGILAIVFRSVGLPERYDLARFVMWLRDNACLEQVRSFVETKGKTWEKELPAFLVSPVMHQAIVEHFPGWKTPLDLVGNQLLGTFPKQDDVSNKEMVEAVRDALTRDGKFPRTLLAVDEVQQYISDSSDRAYQVQEATEECCKRFGASLLIVGTGQSAMASTPQLLKLKGRFPPPYEVQLSDADVDTVIRKLVLLKRPDKTAAVASVLDKHNGEISRHLAGSAIGKQSEDATTLVPDYPLLPVRRRFWEKALRAVDSGGTTVQLRNQLGVVYEAVRATADKPLGNVIPGDFLYFQLAPILLQTGVLPREVHEIVGKLQTSGGEDNELKARLIALVFLIGKLPRSKEEGGDLGVRADADTLADLLVEDLEHGSADIRKRVNELLPQLVDAGQLMQVDSEYRVQTRESAAWESDYQRHYKAFLDDDTKLATARAEAIAAAVKERLKLTTVPHGAAKVPRKALLHFGPVAPNADPGVVPVWVRDGWAESESSVQSDAIKAGDQSPLVFVLLPNRNPEDVRKNLASLKAAEITLTTRGAPTNEEGNLAKASVETRQTRAKEKLETMLGEILDNAQVIQAGGNDVAASTLADAVRAAADNALVRLFPNFAVADHAKWEQVVKKAREGDGSALAALGHTGDADKHPVCVEVLKFTAAERTGSDIRKRFEGPPYGWPGDAVDGALYALLVTEHLRASTSSGQPLTHGSLDRAKIGLSKFRAETVPLTVQERLAVRTLMQKVGVSCKAGEEAATVPTYLAELKRRAEAAGGGPPRPERPSMTHLSALEGYSGNALVKQVHDARDRLSADAETWEKRGKAIAVRLPRWEQLAELLDLAASLPIAAEVGAQRDAITDQRALLADPDPVPKLCEQVTNALREALVAASAAWLAVHEKEMAALVATDAWSKLAAAKQQEVLRKHGIAEVPDVKLGTEAEVIAAAKNRSLAQWALEQASLPGRFNAARLDAVKLVAPKATTVVLPKATLQSQAELDSWLGEVRFTILEKLKDGPVVV